MNCPKCGFEAKIVSDDIGSRTYKCIRKDCDIYHFEVVPSSKEKNEL